MTAREKEVMGLILEGLTNKKIGLKLGIAEKTVKWHTEKLYREFGVKNRSEFIVKAYRDMLDEPYEDSYKAYVDLGEFI